MVGGGRASGCGKTTLLRLIAGLERPDSGDVLMNGKSLLSVPPEKRNVAMVFQEPALYPHLTVFENIGFGLRLRRYASEKVRERVHWAAEMLDLSACLGRKPFELSGGQRQRVAVGRALVRRPDVFLFDEPLESLDLRTREEMRQKLLKVCRVAGGSVVYVTHDQAEAMMLADKLAILHRGRLQQFEKPAAAYHRPANLFVAQFLGSPAMNLCRGKLSRNGTGVVFQSDGWSLPVELLSEQLATYVGKTIMMGIRPEHIIWGEQGSTDSFPAAVVSIEELGAERRVHLRLGNDFVVARDHGTGPIAAASCNRIRFDQSGVRFFDPESTKAIP